MKASLLLALILSLAAAVAGANPFTSGAGAVSNPFTSGADTVDGRNVPPAQAGDALPLLTRLSLLRPLIDAQRAINHRLAAFVSDFREAPSAGTAALVMFASFIFGIVHAMLPGHRKVVIFSYFLTHEARVWQGILTSVLMGMLHAFSVLAIIGGVYAVAHASLSMTRVVDDAGVIIQRWTAWLVLAIGLWLFISSLWNLFRHHEHEGMKKAPDSSQTDAQIPEHKTGATARSAMETAVATETKAALRPGRSDFWKILPFVVISAIVPCPGASMIFMLSISFDVIVLGMWAILALSLGMALVLTVISTLTIVFKHKAVGLLETRLGHAAHHIFEVGGSLTFLFFAAVYLV